MLEVRFHVDSLLPLEGGIFHEMVEHELHVLHDLRVLSDVPEPRQGSGALKHVVECDDLHVLDEQRDFNVEVVPDALAVFQLNMLIVDLVIKLQLELMHADQWPVEVVNIEAARIAVFEIFAALAREINRDTVVAIQAKCLVFGSLQLTPEGLL